LLKALGLRRFCENEWKLALEEYLSSANIIDKTNLSKKIKAI